MSLLQKNQMPIDFNVNRLFGLCFTFAMHDNSNQETAGAAFERLVSLVSQLRAPDGCPWDKEQTHQTLRASLIEETAETLDAIEKNDDENLREELGDLVLQPIFHAQIASEESRFDIADVLNEICEKLVRRHPHVWGDTRVENTANVLANWDAIKRQEKADKAARNQVLSEHRVLDVASNAVAANAVATNEVAAIETESVLDNIPPQLPALSLAMKVSKRAAKVGFEWHNLDGVLDKLREEIDELKIELERGDKTRASEELGDVLFTIVNIARWQKIDAELALRDTVVRFTNRFQHMEQLASTRSWELEDLSPAQWDELWNEAKSNIRE